MSATWLAEKAACLATIKKAAGKFVSEMMRGAEQDCNLVVLGVDWGIDCS